MILFSMRFTRTALCPEHQIRYFHFALNTRGLQSRASQGRQLRDVLLHKD